MRRFLPSIAGGLVAFVVIGVATGSAAGLVAPLLVAAPVGGAVAWWRGRRGAQAETTWGRSAPFAFVPAAANGGAPRSAVILALGRVESRELLASASYGIGIGFALLVVVLFGFAWSDDFGGDLPRFIQLLAIFVHPLVGMSIVASFRGRTRGRRDGVEELFVTCPASDATRTAGHLVTAGLAVVVLVGSVALLVGAVMSRAAVVHGDVGGQEVAAVLAVVVLGVGGVAAGVALARHLPWLLTPIVAVIGIGFLSAELATFGDRSTDAVRQLSTWLGDTDHDVRFAAPHWWAHVLWLLGLTAVVALLAIIRDERRRWPAAALAASLVGTAVAGWAATRPIDGDDAVRIAAMLADPPSGQDCVERGAIRICTFAEDVALRDLVADEIAPVVAAVPGDIAPRTIRDAADLDRRHLDPEVAALLSPPRLEPDLLPIEFSGTDDALAAARVWVALGATGSIERPRPGATVDLRGQARGVLSLWLATRGASAGTTEGLTSFDPDPQEGEPEHRPWPDPCYAGPAPVRWAGSDVVAARLLTQLPESEVMTVVASDWSRFVDPATATDDLLTAVGLAPLGPFQGSTRVGEC